MNVRIIGRSAAVQEAGGLRLMNFAGNAHTYANAQLDDYSTLRRPDFLWRPPLCLSLRARFSHEAEQLHGTAGFGFWNDPFLMTGWRRPALPRAHWFFFASPPSDMALALDVPGFGWKAAVIDAAQPSAVRWLPAAPLLVPLMRAPHLYRRLWPAIQRDLHIAEASVPGPMTAWRRYDLEWGTHATTFFVDGRPVLQGAPSPHGPLGMVIWIDNQYMIVHPSGRLGYGVLDLPHTQWLQIDDVQVSRRSDGR